MFSCGTSDQLKNSAAKDTTPTPTTQTTDLASQSFVMTGYVSPININVNNKQYKDSEDFYTQEVAQLTSDIQKKYPGYSFYFDATVGLEDFKEGLSVYLVASGATGIASESSVDSTGQFTFNLPPNVDKQAMYTLRASKRIGLILTKENEPTITWCYNLYAQNQINLTNNQFILRDFQTVITSYQCQQEQNASSITIPDNPYNYVTAAFQTGKNNGYGPYIPSPTPSATPTPVHCRSRPPICCPIPRTTSVTMRRTRNRASGPPT